MYLISPPCPSALIAPQQTGSVTKFPAVGIQGCSVQELVWGGCGGMGQFPSRYTVFPRSRCPSLLFNLIFLNKSSLSVA